MSGSSSSDDHHPPDMVQLLEIMENLRQQNESLQESVHTLQQSQSTKEVEDDEELLYPQPLSEMIWDDQVVENFKPPPLPSFDGQSNPQEHIISLNNLMSIVGAFDSLECKLMAGTFKDVALC